MKKTILVASLALPLQAAAVPQIQPSPAAQVQTPQTGHFQAEYTGISHGLTVLKLTAELTLTPDSYAAHVAFHTAGLVGMILHSDNDSTASGRFEGEGAAPLLFTSTGHLRGTARATRLEYKDGDPTVCTLAPPIEQERTAIPVADTRHTIDTLSAVALLIRQVARHGVCDGAVTTFDGRRLSTQTVHTVGEEDLPKTSRSSFSGRALRCDFDGRQLGGFVKTEDEDDLKKPRHGSAWLASMVPGAPPVPVRIMFQNKLLGDVTLYLDAVTGGPATQ